MYLILYKEIDLSNIFSSKRGIILAGAIIGIVATLLQYFGNPANMGFCIACFERDIAGAIGLHNVKAVQFVRVEIIAIVFGALIASLISKEFKARGGSSTLVRFFLGFFAMIGALVFLGCPWRAFIRLAGGDLNAILGILGLIAGIAIGTQFIKKGFSLGRSYNQVKFSALIMPLFFATIFILFIFGFDKLNLSTKGPGAMHAPLLYSLIGGLVVGYLAQRSRFCTVGAIRDILVVKSYHLFFGLLSFTLSVFVLNLLLGQFNLGFQNQPIAHTDGLWSFFAMVLAGLSFSLAGGCPGRQLILSGEGDSDAGVFVMGMIVGAGISHNFALASSPKGIGEFGAWGVVVGLVFVVLVAVFYTKRAE